MSNIVVGNAPVSWGVYEAGVGRNPPFAHVLDAIEEAGYQGTELGPYGYYPTDAQALERELKARNLTLGSSFVPIAMRDPNKRRESVERALAVAKLLSTQGVREVIIADEEHPDRAKHAGRIPKDGSMGFSDRDWAELRTTLHAIGEALKDNYQMRVVVHHHAGTFVETEGEIDRLLYETDPGLVNLLLDTGHAVYGGADPVTLIEKHHERIRYLHYKDVDPKKLSTVRSTKISMSEAWKLGVFCPLGHGVVDFPRVTERLRSRAYSGWVIVEQDVMPDAGGRLHPDPTESAKESRRFLRSLEL